MSKKETIQVKKTAGSGITLKDVQDKFIVIQNQNVLLDSDVAALYGVETREINQAIKNNPHKFPEGYVIQLEKEEWKNLKSKFLTSSLEEQEVITNFDNLEEESDALRSKILILEKNGRGQHVKYLPKAFTRKGCYMLATILKGEEATATTITIIEAFDKLIELKETVAGLSQSPDKYQQKSLMQKGGDIIAEILSDDLTTTEEETSIELNFALFKFKHTTKRKK